jgi:hypothetical protein
LAQLAAMFRASAGSVAWANAHVAVSTENVAIATRLPVIVLSVHDEKAGASCGADDCIGRGPCQADNKRRQRTPLCLTGALHAGIYFRPAEGTHPTRTQTGEAL